MISLPVMVFMTHRPGVIVGACGKHALSATLTEKLLRALKYNSSCRLARVRGASADKCTQGIGVMDLAG